MEVKLVMLRQAQSQNMMRRNGTSKVTRFDDIGLLWQEDGSLGNAEVVFAVLYGWFDLHPNWALEIEQKYMQSKGLEYDESPSGKRGDMGCIEWYIHHAKNELTKLVNARTSITHKKRITITREKGTITLHNRWKRRLKGVFYAEFVKDAVHSQPLSSLESPDHSHDSETNLEYGNKRHNDMESGNKRHNDMESGKKRHTSNHESRELKNELRVLAEGRKKETEEWEKERRQLVIVAAKKACVRDDVSTKRAVKKTKAATKKSSLAE